MSQGKFPQYALIKPNPVQMSPEDSEAMVAAIFANICRNAPYSEQRGLADWLLKVAIAVGWVVLTPWRLFVAYRWKVTERHWRQMTRQYIKLMTDGWVQFFRDDATAPPHHASVRTFLLQQGFDVPECPDATELEWDYSISSADAETFARMKREHLDWNDLNAEGEGSERVPELNNAYRLGLCYAGLAGDFDYFGQRKAEHQAKGLSAAMGAVVVPAKNRARL